MWIFPWIKLSWYPCSMWEQLGWLNWFWQLLCETLFSFKPKGFYYSCMVLQFMWRKDFLLHKTTLENSADSYACFQMALLHSVSYFFFLYQSLSWPLCTVFDVISSKIHEVLWVNPSTVFVFAWYEEVSPIIQGFRISLFSLSVS